MEKTVGGEGNQISERTLKVKEEFKQHHYKDALLTNFEEPQEYVFPPIQLLTSENMSEKEHEEMVQSLTEIAEKLQRTLTEFKINATIINICYGSKITRYQLKTVQSITMNKIVNLTNDIKLRLAAEDIHIEVSGLNKAIIDIDVLNKRRRKVIFRSLLESDKFIKTKSKTAFIVGEDIVGKVVVAEIEKMPHILIAGQTGSGKSVYIDTIIMSILYKARPSEVKFIIIDSNAVEFDAYNGIPHLLFPVVTDRRKALAALKWVVNEMEARYEKIKQYKVNDISEYNGQIDQNDDMLGKERLEKIPRIIIVIDDLADLVIFDKDEISEVLCKLTQKAAKVGIHLIVSTQRPSIDVIAGTIKANFPSRIAFSVTTKIDSRIILGESGAEKLRGNGEMLFKTCSLECPIYIQSAFISNAEIKRVVNFFIQSKYLKVRNDEFQKKMIQENVMSNKQRDELFEKVGYFIIEQKKVSMGNIQRHFRMGFNRTLGIVDQLCVAGVVSKDEGTRPRKVLMNISEFENYLANK